MSCNCCNGIGHEFESKGMKCKIVIRNNTMSVALPWNAIDIDVKACPMCGRELIAENELPLSPGDDVWYVDTEAKEYFAEHGVIEYISIESGTMIDYASVKFDNGDIDDFGPNGFGRYYFKTEDDARKAWEAFHE